MNHFSDTPTNSRYYDDGGISAFDFIQAKDLNFALGNVIKYVSRAGRKNPETLLEDLQKARWYLDAEIDRVEEGIERGTIDAYPEDDESEGDDTEYSFFTLDPASLPKEVLAAMRRARDEE